MDKWMEKLLGLSIEDVNELDSWVYDSCIDEDKFVEFVQEQAKELGQCVWDLDLYSLLLEFIAMDADVSELIPFLYNHGNRVTFRISPEEAGKLLAQVSEEDRNESWYFILDLIEVELPDDTEIDG